MSWNVCRPTTDGTLSMYGHVTDKGQIPGLFLCPITKPIEACLQMRFFFPSTHGFLDTVHCWWLLIFFFFSVEVLMIFLDLVWLYTSVKYK